jgi:hypothetical protein
METNDFRIIAAREFLTTKPKFDELASDELVTENTELRRLLQQAIDVADDWAASEPRSPEDLEAEFRGWHVWKGVNNLWYARRPGTSPCLTAERAGDLHGLRQKIIIEIRRWENGPIR